MVELEEFTIMSAPIERCFDPANHATKMRDVFCFAAPQSLPGRIAELLFRRHYMQSLLRERNTVLKQIAESPDYLTAAVKPMETSA